MNLRRKRMILMRDVWYGYNRTASGNPVTLEAAKRLRQLTIYGNAVQSNLPSGYTEVGYIESTGTQWINTNFHADQDSGIYLDAQLTEVPEDYTDNNALMFCGCVNNNFGIGISSTNHTFSFMRKSGVGAINNGSTGHSPDTDRHIFKNNFFNDHYFVLDSEFLNAPDANFSNDYGIAIFRTTYGSNTSYYNAPIKARIYRLKLSQGNEIIADLCPAKRDSDGAVGMYDTVTGAFLTNSGTGVFVAGAAVTPTPDTPVDIQLCGDRTGNLYNGNL